MSETKFLEVQFPIKNEDQLKLANDIIDNHYNLKSYRLEGDRLYINKNGDFYPLGRLPESWLRDKRPITSDELLFKQETCPECRHAVNFTDDAIYSRGEDNGKLIMHQLIKEELEDYGDKISFDSMQTVINKLEP